MTKERLSRITIDDAQCGGRPCIRGMRIRINDILELLRARASIEEVLQDYPGAEREDILASIEHHAHQTDHAVLLSASSSSSITTSLRHSPSSFSTISRPANVCS